MLELNTLQKNFQNYLLHEKNDIQKSIISTRLVSNSSRLAIYRQAYHARLLEALASNYPCLHDYLGEKIFTQIGTTYINLNPSSYRSIRWFGENLYQKLATFFPERPYLIELAEFEWKMTLAFDNARHQPFTIEKMQAIPKEAWSEMCLIPHPSLQRMNFSWNTLDIWQKIIKKEQPPTPIKTAAIPWALWHYKNNQYYSLEEDEDWALEAVCQGLTFNKICEGLCNFMNLESVGMRAASLLKNWVQKGLLLTINY